MIFALLLAIVFTAFGVLAWRDLKIAIIVLLGLLPAYLVRFSVGPVPMTLLEGFLLIVIGVYGVKMVIGDRRLGIGGLGWVIGGLILSMMAIIVAPDHVSALGIWKAYFLEPVLLGVIVMKVFDRADYEKALRSLSISGAIIGFLAILQMVTKIGIPDAWAIEGRATSIFPYPNAVGLLLAPIAAAMIVQVYYRWRNYRGQKNHNLVLKLSFDFLRIALMLGGIVAAKTEAALVAIPATLLVIAIMMPTIAQKTKTRIVVASVAAAMMLFAFVPTIASKLTLHDTSGLVRRSQWSETLRMLADHSILGAGLNSYPATLVPYHTATEYEIFQYPHNIFLNAWSELGLIGLIGLIGFMVWTVHFAWMHRKEPMVLVSFGALVTMSVHGLVDVPFFKNDLAVMTVFFFVMMISKAKKSEA